uniref:RNA (guanine-9-)-methyltransferase domain-containing protein 1 n=1 Tax=Steinernema glaseri TaxID=37863 RepID=A0A1I7ZIS3_9BILA
MWFLQSPMNRVRAFWHHLLEKIAPRKLVRPREPLTLEWDAPRLRTFPSEQLWKSLEGEHKSKLKLVVEEVEKLSRVYAFFPEQITDADWMDLARIDSAKQRLDHVKHLRRCERLKEKDERKTALKKEARQQRLKEMKEEARQMLMVTNTAKMTSLKKQLEEQRYVRSLMVSKPPTIVFDCRFLPYLSMRGLNLTTMQLQYVISENRSRKEPWPMYFTNCDFSLSPELMKSKQKHLTVLDSRRVAVPEYTSKNTTELFPRERILYLSPNAEDELESIEDDAVFVVGGIVDRVVEHGIPLHASKEAAEADGVKSVRLPLDKYVKWESGTKYLTLTAVMSILQDVYATGGDWPEVLKSHIPRRNVTSPEEKNQFARAKHQRIRELDRKVLEALKN